MRFKRLDSSLIAPLVQMLQGIEPTFRPFDFTARAIVANVKEGDEHWVITLPDGSVIAYGMLRGWADGWSVPALGVAVDKDHRNRGLGTAMVLFLHYRAKERGASHVMLKVDGDNHSARSIYRALGYRQEGDRWVCLV